MNEELLELTIKKIEELGKKIEKYYHMLNLDCELAFVMKGCYLTNELDSILAGEY